MLRISVAGMLLPTLTTYRWPVRKSRVSCRGRCLVLSLVMSLVGTMVLNAEL